MFKQVHFYTDLLDSKQIHLPQNITSPTSTFNKLEKFPIIEVPKSYWKHWSAIIKTLYSSTKVSGFYVEKIINKHMMRFLQSNDREFLLFRTKRNQYYVFKLVEYARNKYFYSIDYLSATIRYEFCGFQGVQAQVYDQTIVTDGFSDSPDILFQNVEPTTQSLLNLFTRRITPNKKLQPTPTLSLPKFMELPTSNDPQTLDLYK